jgi:hypothetical protein
VEERSHVVRAEARTSAGFKSLRPPPSAFTPEMVPRFPSPVKWAKGGPQLISQ